MCNVMMLFQVSGDMREWHGDWESFSSFHQSPRWKAATAIMSANTFVTVSTSSPTLGLSVVQVVRVVLGYLGLQALPHPKTLSTIGQYLYAIHLP